MQELRRLSRRRSARSDTGTFLIDGPGLLGEAVRAGVVVRTVYVEPAALEDPAVRSAGSAGAVVREVQPGSLAKVLDLVTPQSVVAVADQRPSSLGGILDDAADRARPVLALVAIQDPGNAGTLVRVAEASGCAGVAMTTGSVDVHNPKTVRATAGALFRMRVVEGIGSDELRSAARGLGVRVWATVAEGGIPIEDADLTGASVLLVGSEAHGLPVELRCAADGELSIPMEGGVESLNAAVAGSLVAFEAARQRRSGDDAAGDARVEPGRGTGTGVSHYVSRPTAPGGSAAGAAALDGEERST